MFYSGCFKTQKETEQNIEGQLNETETTNVIQEQEIEKMFLVYGQIYDGNYEFRQYDTSANKYFSYNFVYNPKLKLYNCDLLILNYNNYTTIINSDYVSITFSWGKFKNALFYAHYELNNNGRIEFEFSNLIFNQSTLGDTYTYTVTKNTFANLNDKKDIDAYASSSYDLLCQLIPYMKRIFYSYNITTELW